MYDGPYIRPCAAFPDGYFLTEQQAKALLKRDLLESAFGWAENATENDYYPIYSDETMDRVIDVIVLTSRHEARHEARQHRVLGCVVCSELDQEDMAKAMEYDPSTMKDEDGPWGAGFARNH